MELAGHTKSPQNFPRIMFNQLDAKTRKLISLAVAVTTRCDGCIAFHAAEAKKLGASVEEVSEALGVAINMNTGAALVYSTHVLDAFDK